MMRFFLFERRPWGHMVTLIATGRFWLKYICVYGRTSLQSHNERSEIHICLWHFTYIRPQEQHRMTKGRYLELAFGKPREEDIVRHDDDYGR